MHKYQDVSATVAGGVLAKEINAKKVPLNKLPNHFAAIVRGVIEGKDTGQISGAVGFGTFNEAQTIWQNTGKLQGVDWLQELDRSFLEDQIRAEADKLSHSISSGKEYNPEAVISSLSEKAKLIKSAKTLPKLKSAYDILHTPEPDRRWIIDGILPVGLVMFGGRSKSGKSVLALQALKAISTGGTFLGKQANEGKVLYLNLEDDPYDMKLKMDAQGWIDVDAIETMFGDEYAQMIVKPLNVGGMELLVPYIQAGGYSAVVIDTIGNIWDNKESDMKEYGDMVPALSRIKLAALAANCAIITITHTNKGSGKADDFDFERFINSQAFNATPDTLWMFNRTLGNATGTLSMAGRKGFKEQLFTLQKDEERCSWLEVSEFGVKRPRTQQQDRIAKYLAEKPGATNSDIAQALGIKETNCSKQMKRMQDDGWVVKKAHGYWNGGTGMDYQEVEK